MIIYVFCFRTPALDGMLQVRIGIAHNMGLFKSSHKCKLFLIVFVIISIKIDFFFVQNVLESSAYFQSLTLFNAFVVRCVFLFHSIKVNHLNQKKKEKQKLLCFVFGRKLITLIALFSANKIQTAILY